MQTKIIFFLLFMLTFSVSHDTVINIIHPSDYVDNTHHVSQNMNTQECETIDEIHGMFHFVGLMTIHKSHFIQLPFVLTGTNHLLLYTPPYKDSTYKPPKA